MKELANDETNQTPSRKCPHHPTMGIEGQEADSIEPEAHALAVFLKGETDVMTAKAEGIGESDVNFSLSGLVRNIV